MGSLIVLHSPFLGGFSRYLRPMVYFFGLRRLEENKDMSMGKPDSWTFRITELGKIAGAFTTIVAALTLVWGFTLGPLGDLYDRFNETVEAADRLQQEQTTMQSQQQAILGTLADIVADQTTLLSRVERLESKRKADGRPAIRFDRRGHEITDVAIGGVATFTWRFYKLRECGRPTVDLAFRNGGGKIHRFENLSVLDKNGRGLIYETAPNRAQEISYTASVPTDEGVTAGRSYGWVTVGYPDGCPEVLPVTSPEVSFEILPEETQ